MAPESMADLLRTWDGEDVVVRFDRPTGSWILIAIHSTRLGPAGGGTRMKSYPDPAAALRDAIPTRRYVPGLGDGGDWRRSERRSCHAHVAVAAEPEGYNRRTRPVLSQPCVEGGQL